jgi:glycerophosphoryl diester phosphodiesterase
MKIISHRGNINGSRPNKENSPNYINEAIESGYNVEIDVWLQKDNLFLGHDFPEWQIDPQFLKSNHARLWIHCKNDDAFFYLRRFETLNVFYHAKEDFATTSKNIIIVNPYTTTNHRRSILMMPELSQYTVDEILQFDGIISDNIKFYENCFNSIGKQ